MVLIKKIGVSMDFREVLGVLSKSSPYAVTTDGEIVDSELREIKDYLYVETDIEVAFREKISQVKPKEIIFLCGSSGDGKSEILTRYSKAYGSDINFHFDATHSFNPNETAIETLNDVILTWKTVEKPLVIGINIGMLANYERDGSDDHNDVKSAIRNFLEGGFSSPTYTFLDFESFPKFTLESGKISSSFFSMLIRRVVMDDQHNGFKRYFEFEYGKERNCDSKLVANYLLLRNIGVQKVIIELILNARIKEDQFVTARMLLDFIYCILTGSNYLFDNLFDGGENELLQAISKFDPAVKREKNIDAFILNRKLEIPDLAFSEFKSEIKGKFRLNEWISPISEVRLMYVLKNTQLTNNYPSQFLSSFKDSAEELYRELWELHKNYKAVNDERKVIKAFYDDVVFAAIQSYANRNAPYLSKDEFYLSSHNGFDIASEVELDICWDSLLSSQIKDIHTFNIYLKANDENLEALPINLNLLGLMLDVVAGYRPNRHDKNSVVILGDLVAKISSRASGADQLFLYKDSQRLIRARKNSTGNIKVSVK